MSRMRFVWYLTCAGVALLCTRCTQPVVLTPCRETRELRAQAQAETDGFTRGVLAAKADAAQARCEESGRQNAEHAHESEKRRHRLEAMERDN